MCLLFPFQVVGSNFPNRNTIEVKQALAFTHVHPLATSLVEHLTSTSPAFASSSTIAQQH